MVQTYITTNKVTFPISGENHKNQLFKLFVLVLRKLYIFRNRKFYGNALLEVIQKPGEVIYIPNFQVHAVYNLDETVAVADNPYFTSAVEESAFQLMYKKHTRNFFGKVNGTEVLIDPGEEKCGK